MEQIITLNNVFIVGYWVIWFDYWKRLSYELLLNRIKLKKKVLKIIVKRNGFKQLDKLRFHLS